MNRKTGTTGTANSQQPTGVQSIAGSATGTDYLPRQRESLSPHATNSTRDRSNRPHRKKSTTLRTAAEQPSPLGTRRPPFSLWYQSSTPTKTRKTLLRQPVCTGDTGKPEETLPTTKSHQPSECNKLYPLWTASVCTAITNNGSPDALTGINNRLPESQEWRRRYYGSQIRASRLPQAVATIGGSTQPNSDGRSGIHTTS
jgi:hypothetical protein